MVRYLKVEWIKKRRIHQIGGFASLDPPYIYLDWKKEAMVGVFF